MIIETCHTDSTPQWARNFIDKFEDWYENSGDEYASPAPKNQAIEHFCQAYQSMPIAVTISEPKFEKDDMDGFFVYNFCWRDEKDKMAFMLKFC